MMVERRHHGRQLPRNRAGLARQPAARRSLSARRGSGDGAGFIRPSPAGCLPTDPRACRAWRTSIFSTRSTSAIEGAARHARGGRSRISCAASARCDSSRAIATRILASLPGQDRAIVSEPFANKHDVRAGDRSRIPLGDRTVQPDRRRHLLRLFERSRLRDPRPLDAAASTCRTAGHERRRLPAQPGADARRRAPRHRKARCATFRCDRSERRFCGAARS